MVVKTGEAVHAHQGQCCNKFATAWAVRHGLQVTFKASHVPHGLAESKVLCRAWCHKMQFLYNLEKESAAGPELIYTAAHLASYVEPSEFAALARDAANPSWAARIAAIRRIPFK